MKRRVWQTILAAACLLSLSLTGVVWAAPEAAKEAVVGENMAEETAAEQSPVKLTTREITIMVLEPDEEAVCDVGAGFRFALRAVPKPPYKADKI